MFPAIKQTKCPFRWHIPSCKLYLTSLPLHSSSLDFTFRRCIKCKKSALTRNLDLPSWFMYDIKYCIYIYIIHSMTVLVIPLTMVIEVIDYWLVNLYTFLWVETQKQCAWLFAGNMRQINSSHHLAWLWVDLRPGPLTKETNATQPPYHLSHQTLFKLHTLWRKQS